MKSKVLKLIFVFLLCSKVIFAQWETVYFPSTTTELGFLNSVSFANFNKGMSAGTDFNDYPIIIRTINNGTSWDTVFNVNEISTLNKIILLDTLTAFAVGSDFQNLNKGLIARSVDFGLNWDTTIVNDNLYSIDFPSNNTGYAVGGNGAVYKSIDGGNNWIKLITGVLNKFISVHFINDSTGCILGDSLVFKTNNGGNSWVASNLNTGNYYTCSMSFASDSIGYCSFFGADTTKIFKTSDYGNSWNLYSSIFCYNFINSMFFTDNNTGYISGFFLLEKTIDGGLTWLPQTSSLPSWGNFFDWVADIFFLNQDTGFAVGRGQFYRTTIAGGATVSVNDINNPEKNTISIYPNPATDQITIELPNSETGKIELSIVNLMGQMIYKQEIFDNSKIIDISQFVGGIYFMQAKTKNKKTYNKKIIIAR